MFRIAASCRRLFPPATIVAAALWVVYPILGQLNSGLPIRTNQLTTVPLFNAWTIWWNADRLTHAFDGYWQAPIFFPADSTFAFSEPQPSTLVVAPVLWVTGSPAAAYNSYLILSLILNGVFAYIVLRNQGCCRLFGTLGAVMMVWLPLGLDQLEVLQLVPVWPMLLVWDVVCRHGRNPGIRTGTEAALAYTICFYSCIHHTLFLTVVLAGTGWVLFRSIRTMRFWTASVLSVVLAGILVGIVLIPIRQTLHGEPFERSQELVARLSARRADLWSLPSNAIMFGAKLPGFHLSPGWLKIVLAGFGMLFLVCRKRRRRWKLFLTLTIVCSALLALGPNLKLGGWQPWWTVSEFVPGMGQVRNVFRFAYLTQMAIILMAVLGLSETAVWLRAKTGKPRVVKFALAALGLAAVFEVPALRPQVAGVPDLQRNHQWTEFIKKNTPVDKWIACLPFSPGTRAADFDTTARWMYYGTLHGIPMVNGYSGFFPEQYMKLRQDITKRGPDSQILDELAAMKVHFLVVRSSYQMPDGGALMDKQDRLQLVYRDPVGIDIYQLTEQR